MMNTMKEVLYEIRKRMVRDLCSYREDAIDPIRKMYNDYQKDMRDGVDYIFNLHDKNDLVCCINGGLEASEIAKLVCGMNNGNSEFFYFGVNHEHPKQMSKDELINQLISCLDDILPYVLVYPHAFDSYKEVYKSYFTPYFEIELF